MMITAEMIRQIIVDHDAARPRSRQTAVGPSDLSSPCDRKLLYQILGTPPVVPGDVNLKAWVGTAVHSAFEQILTKHDDWLSEQKLSITVAKGLKLVGHLDAYHKPTYTVLDFKTTGPSAHDKYRRQSPQRYLDQVAIYGLLAVLSGRMRVDYTGLVYVPRNGDLRDIHVDVHPWDQDRADAAITRYERLHIAAGAGPQVIDLVNTADDCTFCGWWNVNAWADGVGCPGHKTSGAVPAETQPIQEKETVQ